MACESSRSSRPARLRPGLSGGSKMRTYIPYIGAISITPADGSDLAREVRALSANATGNLTIMLAGHPVLTVTGATNPATPIEITTAEAHGLETNDKVYVSGVGGNTNANGLRSIIKTAYNKFTLTGS